MRTDFWTVLLLTIAALVFMILGALYWLHERAPIDVAEEAAIRSLVSAEIFIAARLDQLRQVRHCALCDDHVSDQSTCETM